MLYRCPRLLLALLLTFGLCPCAALCGENVTWDFSAGAPPASLGPAASSNDNTVTVTLPDTSTTAPVNMEVRGAATSATATYTNNHIVITGQGSDKSTLQGGIFVAPSGTVTNSSLTLNGVAYTGSPLLNQSGGVSDSRMTILNSTVTGGASLLQGGSAYGNTMTVENSTVTGEVNIASNFPMNSYTMSGNTLTVTNSTTGIVNVGYGEEARDNHVIITDSTTGGVIAGNGHNRGSFNSSVTLTGVSQVGPVVGGQSSGISTGNWVRVEGNDVHVRGSVMGGYSAPRPDEYANENKVFIEGGIIDTAVIGARVLTGKALNNAVSMHGGTVGTSIYGAMVSEGDAIGNTVELSGGTVGQDIYGGYTSKGNATGNTVTISGGVTGAAIYGGYTLASGNATGNTVNISGSPDLRASFIYGGYARTGNGRTGNTLNIFSKGLTARNVGNFENYNFILPADIAAGDTVLNLTDTAQTNLNTTKVGVGKLGGGNLLSVGETIYLLTNTLGGISTTGLAGHTIRGQHGVSIEYDFTVFTSDKSVYLTVGKVPPPTPPDPTPPDPPVPPDPTPPDPPVPPDPPGPDPTPPNPPNPPGPSVDPNSGVRVNPATKALAEAKVAMVAFINQGSALALKGALSAQPRQEDPWGLNFFTLIAGSTMRYDTGSHVDISGSNMVAGVSKAVRVSGGRVLLGAFVEAGLARYATHNGFADRPSVQGKGQGRYYGGGLLAHYSQSQQRTADGKTLRRLGAHAESTVRAGHMEMDFASSDLRDIAGRQAHYETSAPYVGGHVGVGYVWDLGPNTSLDTYTEVHATHLGANAFSVLGDPIRMEAVDSVRWRTGFALEHQWNAQVRGHVGAAYQLAFGGTVRGKAYHLQMPRPTLQGSAGIGEAGLNLRPGGENGAFSLDITVHGAVGQQQGMGGDVQFQYDF